MVVRWKTGRSTVFTNLSVDSPTQNRFFCFGLNHGEASAGNLKFSNLDTQAAINSSFYFATTFPVSTAETQWSTNSFAGCDGWLSRTLAVD